MSEGDLYQVGSRTCGCVDCIEDYPPAQYGDRPRQAGCVGRWQVRYRTPEGQQRQKTVESRADAVLLLRTQAVGRGA
ncbi:hypothetical protein [Streptomyces sp. NPDC017448]|uniref:hypothetical protein n=1 Tax=Streptomyces sp. NPDC017448 TaxID=3364996 RepID=UPI0037B081E2